MAQTATPNFGWQNKFSTTLTTGITATDTTIGLNTLPTPTEGFLVIEPDSSTAWEVIYYTSKTGSAVVCPSVGAGRGQDDSNASSHSAGATVRMDSAAGMFEVLKNASALDVNSITPDKLATNAITLGYAQITTSFATTSTTNVQVTGLTVTVTIPAGARRVKLTAWARDVNNSGAQYQQMNIWDGVVAVGTQLAEAQGYSPGVNQGGNLIAMAVVTVSAGSKTYNVGLKTTGNTATIECSTASPAFLLVELI